LVSNRKDYNREQNCPEATDKETDQSPPGYYYDDSTGYETYDPEADADEPTEAEGS
jgi:hypothetical protein